MKKITLGAVFALVSLLTAPVHAATVAFATSPTVNLGATFTLDLIGTGFAGGTDGGGVNVAFDASVLNVLSVSLDPIWDVWADTGTIDNSGGSITGIDFSTFSSMPSDFTIGSIQFQAIGAGASGLSLTESFGIGGFALSGEPQTVSFLDGSISVTAVPLPAALWLMLSGLTALGILRIPSPVARKSG